MFDSGWLLDGFVVLFLVVLFIQLLQKNAVKLGLVDIPNNRSSHTTPTPRGAGIAMFFAVYLVFVFFHIEFFLQYSGFFLATGVIFLLGLADDILNTAPRTKLLVIAVATGLLFFMDGLAIDTLGHWFGIELQLPYVISFFVTVFAVAGFTNALNLIDGLDGLAGSISLVILASLYYIGFVYHDAFIMLVSFVMIVSLIGFLLFNWYPASIFMGDSGSLVLGFVISALAIKAVQYVSDTTILFIAAVPIIDTIIVMTRRIQRGQSPFSPDKSHFHHKMLHLKGSVDASVHILVALQILLSALGLLLRDKSDIVNLLLFLVILFLFFEALDDRQVHRNLLWISRMKNFFTGMSKKLNKFQPIYFTLLFLTIALALKIFV